MRPTSTYRLQITADLDLHAAARELEYLHDLGADWVYLSPILAAEPGSTHGYDVVAHDHVDASRGGASGLAALSAEARRLGMGVLVDIVPNHMGVATPHENAWWWDLLRLGRGSRYADAFDVDWAAGGDRVLLPVVGDDDLLADGAVGHLSVVGDELRYHDRRLPIAPGTGGGTPDEVHARQHYALVGWRRADQELNYRRFFSVDTLAAIRVEDATVLAESHVEIRRWFAEGLVDGLRVDHPDGLRDPKAYLDDLAELTGSAYVLVEKILEPGEALPTDWATAGTTGYDVLAHVDRVLTDPAGQEALDLLQARLPGGITDWPQLVHDRKRAVADGELGAETRRIARELTGGQEPPALLEAVAELLACFPVYRSYLPAGRDHLDHAFAAARRHRPDLEAAYAELVPLLSDPTQPAALRFQQTSGMVMAKGVEDCSFYRYSRLTSLNEVGGDPSEFALEVDAFHALMAERQATWPHAMTTLTTHDTKRSEDTRARIGVLAEIPEEWARTVEVLRSRVDLDDVGFACLVWQAALGVWNDDPALRDRLHAYAEKAMREAAARTSWTDPDAAYEDAVHAAVDALFDDEVSHDAMTALVERVDAAGWVNAVAAKLLSITLPGVPDVYQGSELAEQSLVDPDNRRPVDFDRRRALLDEVRSGRADLGRPELRKLAVTHAALTLRRDRPDLFTTYAGLPATGGAARHVVAYDRGGAVTVVTRLPLTLGDTDGWGDTVLALPDGEWRDVLTDARHSGAADVGAVLAEHPVALLVRDDS